MSKIEVFNIDSTYKRNRRLTDAALLVMDRAARFERENKQDEHLSQYARELNLPYHLVNYHAHRLAARGIIELRKVGSLQFIHFVGCC